MKNIILQFFKRNPFSSEINDSYDNHQNSSPYYQVHKNHQYRILSYFDGMCIQPFDGLESAISDVPCKECVAACQFRNMAIHAERKKLILFSRQDYPTALHSGKHISIKRAPLIALVSIGSLYDTDRKADIHSFENVIEITLQKVTQLLQGNDVVFYQVFRALSSKDIYVLLNANSWTVCERLINELRYKLNVSQNEDAEAEFSPEILKFLKSHILQTYTIIGYDRRIEHPTEIEDFKEILEQKYAVNIHMQTIPGITPTEAEQELRKDLPGACIKSIVGHYDLDISANLTVHEFIHLVNRGGHLGWFSPIAIGSDTHVEFELSSEHVRKNPDHYAYNWYQDSNGKLRQWLLCQIDRNTRIDEQYRRLNYPQEMISNLLSLYRSCCQRLVLPQIWGVFNDVKRLVERYFFLLEKEICFSSTVVDTRRSVELFESITQMIDVISALTNDRLYLDFPSFEYVVNNVYEKGAYEELIQALTLWMQQLEQYAAMIEGSDNGQSQQEREKNDNTFFHVGFTLVPTLYGQTHSFLHFPSANHLKRVVIVKVSSSEMVRIREILPSLAHEVGHYIGINRRHMRLEMLMRCTVYTLVNSYVIGRLRRENLPIYVTISQDCAAATERVIDYLEKTKILQKFDRMEDCSELLHEAILQGFQASKDTEEWGLLSLYLSKTGLPQEIPPIFFQWCDEECDDIIEMWQNLIRELSADTFMILTTKIDFEEYLNILSRQTEEYYITNIRSVDDQWQWLPLYARVIFLARLFDRQLCDLKEIEAKIDQAQKKKHTLFAEMLLNLLSAKAGRGKKSDKFKDILYGVEIILECYEIYGQHYIRELKEAHDMASNQTKATRRRLQDIYDTARNQDCLITVLDKINTEEENNEGC